MRSESQTRAGPARRGLRSLDRAQLLRAGRAVFAALAEHVWKVMPDRVRAHKHTNTHTHTQ